MCAHGTIRKRRDILLHPGFIPHKRGCSNCDAVALLEGNLQNMAESVNRDWKTIAQLAAGEQDPRKLFELVTELNKILEEEERRIQGKPMSKRGA